MRSRKEERREPHSRIDRRGICIRIIQSLTQRTCTRPCLACRSGVRIECAATVSPRCPPSWAQSRRAKTANRLSPARTAGTVAEYRLLDKRTDVSQAPRAGFIHVSGALGRTEWTAISQTTGRPQRRKTSEFRPVIVGGCIYARLHGSAGHRLETRRSPGTRDGAI